MGRKTKSLHNAKQRIMMMYFNRNAGHTLSIRECLLVFWMVSPLVMSAGMCSEANAEEQYTFDDGMLVGAAKDEKTMSRLNNGNTVSPGNYQVDIYVNGNFLNRQAMQFSAGKNGSVYPCFSHDLLISAGVLPDSIKTSESANQCLNLADEVKGANTQFDFARLRLDMFVPQAQMARLARGAVPLENLTAGETALFANYDTNYYHTKASGNYTSDSTYLGLNSGLNLGLWQLRQQSSYTNYSTSTGSDSNHWNSIRTYVQRPIPLLKSELTLGDSYTSGSLFSSISFRGIQLESDDRMLPESQRGYAPTIRGVASTNAKVTITQSGTQIYQTTVAPGPFVIDDLYPTSYQGDLVVQVQEADGHISSFTVPFAAVPESMRPGRSHISLSAGQVRDIGDSNDGFADVTYQRGLTNAITTNLGGRVSDGYQALLGGAVFASEIGALGLNAVYSRANMWGDYLNGWRFGATFSRTFTETSTTLALAGYRYSTKGYRDLSDVLGLRDAKEHDETWSSSTYEQRNQFVLTLSQQLGSFGQTYISGSTNTYRDGRGRDTQYQIGYSNHIGSLSYNLSLSRQKVGATQYGVHNGDDVNDTSTSDSGTTENTFTLSFSLPLGEGDRSPVLSTGYSHQSGNGGHDSYQSSLTGTLGESQTTSYNLNAAYDTGGTGTSEGLNLTQELPSVTLGGNVSHSKDYTQWGASARGAIVAHSGGITAGPYLSDTFALIEADGAEGAEVNSGMGAKINHFGYAIAPSLTPYSYNDVSLDSKGIKNPNVELVENQQRVAPYAGAIVKLHYKSVEGYALLIKVPKGATRELPLGANVYDSKNSIVGLVGQGNQIYARVADKKGTLWVKWDDSATEKCSLAYDINGKSIAQTMYHLELPCVGN